MSLKRRDAEAPLNSLDIKYLELLFIHLCKSCLSDSYLRNTFRSSGLTLVGLIVLARLISWTLNVVLN